MAFTGEIGHLTGIESPLLNAGGVVRTVIDVEIMAQTGVGAVEAGSYTIEPRSFPDDKPNEVYSHDPSTGETRNNLKMPNQGLDVLITEIPEMVKITHAYNKPLIINVAPVGEDPVAEVLELVSRTYEAGADAVLVNAGCRNVRREDGSQKEMLSDNPRLLRSALRGLLRVVRSHNPVFVRLAPYEEDGHKRLMASQALWTSGTVSAAFVCNSFKTNDGVGGRSGLIMADASAIETEFMVHYFRDTNRDNNVDVVRSCGVANASELKRSLDLGAVAGAASTIFNESGSWKEPANRILSELEL